MYKAIPERLTLTTDAEQVAKLQRKREEYRERADAQSFQAPERRDYLLGYKLAALDMLLEKGEIVTAELRAVCEDDNPLYNDMAFEQAVRIIACYNSADYEHLHGGTGLR